MARNCNSVTAKKKLPSLHSSQQHFADIFASEPMTLNEIDNVSFLVEHAQTFFAGEVVVVPSPFRACSLQFPND